MRTKDQFLVAYARLLRLAPGRLRSALQYLHEPDARLVRVPVAVLCIVGSCFSFLPVLGPELFPVGLMLLAHDVKSLQRPAGRVTMWLLDQYERAYAWGRHQYARWSAWYVRAAAGIRARQAAVRQASRVRLFEIT